MSSERVSIFGGEQSEIGLIHINNCDKRSSPSSRLPTMSQATYEPVVQDTSAYPPIPTATDFAPVQYAVVQGN